MKPLGLFLQVPAQASIQLLHWRPYSAQNSTSSRWIRVAESVPKTYAVQAGKLALSLEGRLSIAGDGRVVNVRNGVKIEVRAEDLMSFYVTKKKTKLTPANLRDIVEDMKAIHMVPLHPHSKKVFEEAKRISRLEQVEVDKDKSQVTRAEGEIEDTIKVEPSIDVNQGTNNKLVIEEATISDLLESGSKVNSELAEQDTKPSESSQIIERTSNATRKKEEIDIKKTEEEESIRQQSTENPEARPSKERPGEPMGNDSRVSPIEVPVSQSSDKTEVEKSNLDWADSKIYLIVGMSITILVYFFKSRDTKQPSAKELETILNEKPEFEESQNMKYDELKESQFSERSEESMDSEDIEKLKKKNLEGEETVLQKEIKVYLLCYAIVVLYQLYHLQL